MRVEGMVAVAVQKAILDEIEKAKGLRKALLPLPSQPCFALGQFRTVVVTKAIINRFSLYISISIFMIFI